jgi:hypothetical protein
VDVAAGTVGGKEHIEPDEHRTAPKPVQSQDAGIDVVAEDVVFDFRGFEESELGNCLHRHGDCRNIPPPLDRVTGLDAFERSNTRLEIQKDMMGPGCMFP